MAHLCHWPSCKIEVPPAMFACKRHWYTLPLLLRNKVWQTYTPGQELTKRPSADYLEVAAEVQDWIRQYEGGKVVTQRGTIDKATGEIVCA